MAEAAAKDEGDYTVVTRDDGGRQWAYKGKPVYVYSADKAPGDKTGDGFRDVWHVVKP
jgi:predicted lipoprotein with Yx(FWY)xxD motif